ncbi:OLC1v1024775C1 [Oldenlandia corymbosa var. corymbosa]|uniref:OLC1v1024775C1 n=1 Tax=Oldenlandia corymbosa var. corymbosa TaxID=529605 RepID=A0AAV1C604_OLDCO|nr:OLC1v1024775C1 [Oldenlandia corymbosa var. corymbosa]
MVASWFQTLISPLRLKISPQRLRKYGFVLNDFLNGTETREKAVKELSQEMVSWRDLDEVEKIIGYSFSNKSLLHQAFTHPSYNRGCTSYERLEYVGDSVLNLLITKKQFMLYPDLPPGCLTPLRAANVDTEKLARVAVKHGFHKYLRHERAVIARRVTSSLLEPFITPDMLQMNPVKKLFEICQKHRLDVRFVDHWAKEGTYEVFVEDHLRGRGQCHSKKEVALNRAANVAYNEVVKLLESKESC